jgi:hypothetical protein
MGLLAAIEQLEKGGEAQRAAAVRLRKLDEEKPSSPEDYSEVLGEIRRASLLPGPALYCLVADVVEEASHRAAEKSVGTWDDHDNDCWILRNELAERLREVIDEFLRAKPIPEDSVRIAIENANEDFDRTLLAPRHSAGLPHYDTRDSLKHLE